MILTGVGFGSGSGSDDGTEEEVRVRWVGNLGCLVIRGWKRRVLEDLQEKERDGSCGDLERGNGLLGFMEDEGERKREECEVKKSAIFIFFEFFCITSS